MKATGILSGLHKAAVLRRQRIHAPFSTAFPTFPIPDYIKLPIPPFLGSKEPNVFSESFFNLWKETINTCRYVQDCGL